MHKFIRRNALILPLLALMLGLVGLLTYLSGNLGISTRDGELSTAIIISTPPLPGTPVARFAQVNPAIVDYLDNRQPSYGAIPLDALGANVPPVGAYLPKSGSVLFDFARPTPLPTPLPYPTSPPLPNPAVPQQILPTVSLFNEDGTPRLLAYGGDGCAPSGLPVDGILTQRFHFYHSGIDLATGLGTPVLATHSGQVSYAEWSSVGYGYLVIIQNGSFITYYAHNTAFNVTLGQAVGKGSIVAWSGSTGNSTGPHVHYETRINDVPVDPLTFESRGYLSC